MLRVLMVLLGNFGLGNLRLGNLEEPNQARARVEPTFGAYRPLRISPGV